MLTLPRAPTSIPAQLALGLTAVGLSVLGRTWLDPILGDRAPFIFTLATLAALAWVLSAGPYFAAALAGLIAVEYLFVTPRYSPGLEGPADALQFANYVFLIAVLWFAAQTARRHAARALEASEALRRKDELLRTVADGSATLLAYVDRDLRYRFVNAAYCKYFDVKAESVLGRTVPEQVGEAAYAAVRPYLDRVLAGEPITFEAELDYPTLGPRRMHVGFAPNIDANGAVIGYTAAINDNTERAQAQEAAAHLAAIVESTDDAVISKDLSGRIRSFNAGAERLFGYRAADMIGQPITMLIPRERIAEESEILQRIRSGQRIEQTETIRVTKAGRHVDVSLTVSPIRDRSGAIIGASKIARDITHRKAAEADLRRSEERLRIALEAGRMGTWEWNIRTGAVAWSTALEALHGLEPGTFPGTFEAFQSDMHPDDRERVLAAIAACARDHTDHHIEYRIIRPDGRTVWVEGRGRLFLDDAGEPLRMSGVCIDVTERMLSEAALRESDERLRLALDAGQIGIHEYAPTTGALLWDARLRAMWGIGPDDPVNIDTFWRGLHPEDHEEVAARLARATDPHDPVPFDMEYRALPLDGSPQRWIHATGQSSFVGEGADRRADRFVGTARDVTAPKLAAEEIARYRQRLEDLVRERTAQLEHSQHALRLAERMAALGTFAAGLGHDMSNLLLPIRARLESIEFLAGASPELREDTDAIKGSLRYIEAVTRGLRLFAQDPEQNVDGVTNLPRWCADIESLLRASLPKHIALRCDIPPDAPTVAVSPHRLSQAVLNLVHNARDAIAASRPSDGAITVSATIEGDTGLVRLCVQDNGAGMTDEVRRRCTEPFYTTKNRGLGGTGLGLAIVHGVAESAGGRIEIRSAPGEGAAVSLLLPVAPIDASDEPPTRRPAFITIADTRTAAFAASLLASMGREPIAAAPINGVPADALWVTDATPQSAPVAASFLAGAAARRVIALGGDTQWSALGAIVTDHDSLPRLRQAFEQASLPRT